mgnify:CR=1 FL=1
MLANDPHLDNRILPGAWHPVGLFTPEIQAVGAALPGMPGILIGRTQHVAFGVANAYGDVQDLYIETLDVADANRYIDAGRSVPFDVITETIRVKDGAAARRLPRAGIDDTIHPPRPGDQRSPRAGTRGRQGCRPAFHGRRSACPALRNRRSADRTECGGVRSRGAEDRPHDVQFRIRR